MHTNYVIGHIILLQSIILSDMLLLLFRNPDSVMLCVLPVNNSDDIALDIHYTLIEAFCLENDISLLKVSCYQFLLLLLLLLFLMFGVNWLPARSDHSSGLFLGDSYDLVLCACQCQNLVTVCYSVSVW